MRTILFGLVLWCVAMAANNHQNTKEDCICENHDSWIAYCQAYNVDPENPSVAQNDFYVDCWVGSVEEEKALENLKK